MALARPLVQLARPFSSLLAFLALLLPVLSRSGDLGLSLRRSVPILFVAICTFVANDLDDVEKDAVNHPERPLPSGQVGLAVAASAYFTCLVVALLSTRFWVGSGPISFLYYLLMAASISYHYVVEYLPGLKPAYVAGSSVLPVVILAGYYPNDSIPRAVAVALFLFMLGRELCKDLPDRAGDPRSWLHSIPPHRLARAAFALEAIALAMLVPLLANPLAIAVATVMGSLLALAYVSWFRSNSYQRALKLQKGILFLGLYFLF